MRIRPELLALYPPGVAGAELVHLDDADPPLAEELAGLERAAPRRLREFAAGRHCAREALAALGEPRTALPRGPDRGPEWPAGVVGSISHSREYCAAVVARRTACASLGFDAEEWGRITPELWSRIATAKELAWLRGCADAARSATLLFSAKEAFYKAQFPLSRRFVGFADAAFHPVGSSGFEIELLREVSGLGGAGARFPGRHASCALRCYTGVYLPTMPAPRRPG
jgi:4'-phosphopantetheinyl transferase EntD